MGIEIALLFCALRTVETLGTLSFTRDTRAGCETALCLKPEEFNTGLLSFCLTSPALALDVTGNPRRFGSVATGAFKASPEKVRNKSQDRLQAVFESGVSVFVTLSARNAMVLSGASRHFSPVEVCQRLHAGQPVRRSPQWSIFDQRLVTLFAATWHCSNILRRALPIREAPATGG
jgi:hypothetical protein